MKKAVLFFAAAACAALWGGGFTADFEAAKKESAEKKLPMMLDFTGSDWCYWCKVMDRQVFAEKEWKDWAAKNLVCVTVDFPRDEGRQTVLERSRNAKLAREHKVNGFPTFVFLKAGGGEEIARTGCPGRDATPAKFIAEVRRALGAPAK